jgi:opacity protein-like surface antigen
VSRSQRASTWIAGACASALLASPSLAQAADPNQQSFPPPAEDNGVEKPPPPNDRFGHLYIAPSFGVIGGVGAFGPNVPTGSLLGLGYQVGLNLGLGIGRHGVLHVLGDRSAFGAPGDCNIGGCTGTSYTVGLGFSYHLTQALAFDPWASYAFAYRATSVTLSQNATARVDGKLCPTGALCPENYAGLDVARIALGGDFYPKPWLGFGPFIEMDLGTNYHRPTSQPPIGLPPNVTDGPRTYAFFQVGVRVALDPMRGGYRRKASAPPPDVPTKDPGKDPAAKEAASVELPRF